MFHKKIVLELVSCQKNGSEFGEIYFEHAKHGGTYITVMLSGMESVKSESYLCLKEEQPIYLPLPSPCQGKIELCFWSCLDLRSLKGLEVCIFDKNRQKIILITKK